MITGITGQTVINKLRIGIDINETLRAKWYQFDKFYIEEFGEEGSPQEQPYVYDFFKYYKWEDTTENINYLNEELPDDIHPQEYQVDPKTGEAPVDFLAFQKREIKLTAKQVFERFLYEDYLFEIFGAASMMYKGIDQHIEKFYYTYKDKADFIIISKENHFTIPPTLFFLSKVVCRLKKYVFAETNKEIWNNVDILITTDPDLLENIPEGKKVIKVTRPYNKEIKSELEVQQVFDLIENKEFEKIIINNN